MEAKPLMPRKALKSSTMVGETFLSDFPEIARIVFKLSFIIGEIYESKLPQMLRRALVQALLNQSGSSPRKK